MKRGLSMFAAVTTAVFTLWWGVAMSATPAPVFDEPMAGSPYPPKVAVGRDGSVVVAGTTAKESGDKDWSVSLYKKDANGQYFLFWRKSYDGGHDDTVAAVTITPKGEIVVVGTTNNGNDDDLLVLVFSEDGEVKWQRGYPGPHSDKGGAVAVWSDQEGEERIAVGGITNNGSNDDLLVLLYNGQGGMIWKNPLTYDDGGDETLVDLAITPRGGLLVLGNGGTPEKGYWLLLSYSADGERSWVKKEEGDGSAEATDLAVDENGRALVCGTTNGGEGNDWIFTEYSSSGGVFWRGYYRGSHEDKALSVAAIPGLGWAIGGVSYVDEDAGKDGLLMAVDEEGTPLWTKWLEGENDQTVVQVAGDPSGAVVAIGTSNNGKDTDWWVGRYLSSGSLDWEYPYDGGGSDQNPTAAVGNQGEVAVTGNTGEDWKLLVFGPQFGVRNLGQEILEVPPKATTDPAKGDYLSVGEIAEGGRKLEFSITTPIFLDNTTGQPLSVTTYAGFTIPTYGLFFFNQERMATTQYSPLQKSSSHPVKATLIPKIEILDEQGQLLTGLPPGDYLFFVAALYGPNASNFETFDWETERYMVQYTVLNLK